MKNNGLIREATAEEMKAYFKVEEYMNTLTKEQEDWLIGRIGDFVFSYGLERRTNYTRLFRYIKNNNLDITVLDFENWYCIDRY